MIEYLVEAHNYLTKIKSSADFKFLLLKGLVKYGINFLKGKSIGKSVGLYIDSKKPFIIKTWDNFYFFIRPKTSDITLSLLIGEKYELENWFYPNIKGIL
ncbi:MAG: hypothetical protein QXQ14_00280 [Candidatus Aenigmatarchaeota archaeon]